MLASLLTVDGWDARYVESAGLRPDAWLTTATSVLRADLVYLIGGQVQRWSRPDLLTRLSRRPIVMHWVGSDVTYALSAARNGRASRRLIRRPVHWTEVEWTANELRPLGIDAAIVPLTSTRLPGEPQPLPETFTVLAYLPKDRPSFYGAEGVIRLAESLPAAHFLVAGSEGDGIIAPENVEFLGWVADMAPVYARSSVLLRLPRHDGLSFMVLEALAAARHVIWTHPLEGVLRVEGEDEARAQLQRLFAEHRAGTLDLNSPGRTFVAESLSTGIVRAEILRRFAALLGGQD